MLSANVKPKTTAAASRAVPLRQHGFLVLKYHRQVPAPGPFFQWQGIGPARTWRGAATASSPRFHSVPACDRRTDGQTDGLPTIASIGLAATLTPCKKFKNILT